MRKWNYITNQKQASYSVWYGRYGAPRILCWIESHLRSGEKNYEAIIYRETPDHYGMLKAKTAKILMREITLLPLDTPTSDLEKTKYSAKVGSVMYAMVETRVDIALATSMVSRFAKNSSSEQFNAIDQILP